MTETEQRVGGSVKFRLLSGMRLQANTSSSRRSATLPKMKNMSTASTVFYIDNGNDESQQIISKSKSETAIVRKRGYLRRQSGLLRSWQVKMFLK